MTRRKLRTLSGTISLFFIFGGASCDEVKDKVWYLNVVRGGLERTQDKELKTWAQIKDEKVPYYCADERTWEFILDKCYGNKDP